MFDHAQKLFDEMPELNCERTVKSFNALLSACVNAKDYDKISEIFANVPEKLGIEPNVISYNTVIKAFCEMDSTDSAFLAIEEMEKNGLEPDSITFNTLLEAFYKNSRFSDAEKVWEMMREKRVIPNSRSYNPKLRALVSSNRISEAGELIEEMKREGVEPDSFSYNSLIKGFCDSDDLAEAKRWFSEMVKNGCKPDRVTYVVIGYLACKIGDFDYAFELCKEAINAKLVIHKTLAQRVVDGLVRESKMEEAEELVELGSSNNFYDYELKLPQIE